MFGMVIGVFFIGNWVGIILLVLFILMLLIFVLNFKFYEMFLLFMFGIFVCGFMVLGVMFLKGWIVGWLGLLVVFVGVDFIYGVFCFIFGVC